MRDVSYPNVQGSLRTCECILVWHRSLWWPCIMCAVHTSALWQHYNAQCKLTCSGLNRGPCLSALLFCGIHINIHYIYACRYYKMMVKISHFPNLVPGILCVCLLIWPSKGQVLCSDLLASGVNGINVSIFVSVNSRLIQLPTQVLIQLLQSILMFKQACNISSISVRSICYNLTVWKHSLAHWEALLLVIGS